MPQRIETTDQEADHKFLSDVPRSPGSDSPSNLAPAEIQGGLVAVELRKIQKKLVSMRQAMREQCENVAMQDYSVATVANAHGGSSSNDIGGIEHQNRTILQQTDQQQPAKNGGKRAWLSVFGSFMIFVNIWGFTFTFGTFQSYYTTQSSELSDTSASSISWIGTIQSFLLIVGGVMTGPLYDLGAYRAMMVAGMALVLLGLFALSWAKSYYQVFLSQGVCCGLGGALLYVPTLALVVTSFESGTQKTVAMGVVTCGVGLGGVIYVAAFQQLLPQLGFAWTVRSLAFIALGVFLLSMPNLFFENPATSKTATTVTATIAARPKSRKLFDKNALIDRAFQVYSISSFFVFLGYLVPFFYIPSFAEVALHTSTKTGFWALAVSSATSIAGRLLTAFAAKQCGVMAPWIFCAAVSAVLCFCWIRIATVTAFFAFCALYGFFSGALVALPPSIFPRICKDQSLLGTWLGMGWVCSGTAFLLGSPIAGALASIGTSGHSGENLNFLALQIFSGSSLLLGSVLLGGLWVSLLQQNERHAGSIFI